MIKIGSKVKFKVNERHDEIGIVEELITTSLGAGAIVKVNKVNNVSYKILLDELVEVEKTDKTDKTITVNEKDFKEILTDEAASRLRIIKKAIEVTNEDLNISNDTSQMLIELFVKVLADFCANVGEKLFND